MVAISKNSESSKIFWTKRCKTKATKPFSPALTLPEIQIIAQTRDVVDPDAIYKAREVIIKAFTDRNRDKLISVYQANSESGPYSVSADAMAQRSLKNTILELSG